MIQTGSIVLVHLSNPPEQFWGILEDLEPAGVTFRGLNVSSFEDFLAQAARGEELSLGFSTLFVPMFRVERIYLDEQVGAVQSYRQRFEDRVGQPLAVFFGGDVGADDDTPPS
ncbi:MAG TPA: hypothetical protein VMS86_04840 [Thermoanaerobaculia bacterium]|nr:hypothetical protein [Thermoanaerobaculia bacterium]